MFQFGWLDAKKEVSYKQATREVEKFFDGLRENGKQINANKGIKLVYRIGQHRFARDVMSVIRENQILLVQAGVGIGKSMGYLIPILETINQVESFNKVVISTSNIALQQQLLTDLHFVSNLLGIEVKVAIAKGINHYACLKRIDDCIAKSPEEKREILFQLRSDIAKKQTIDRESLIKVSDEVWEQVQIQNRGVCSQCNYARSCLYRNISKEVTSANVVITNHGNFTKSILDNRDYVNDADMFVFDEAHKLEDAVQGMGQGMLNLSAIRLNLNYYLDNNILTDLKMIENVKEFIQNINFLYSSIRKNTSGYFYKVTEQDRDIQITDCDKLPLQNTSYLDILPFIIRNLEKLISDVTKVRNELGYYKADKRILLLQEYLSIFKDMSKGEHSDNIYWVTYYQNNRIYIGYGSKNNESVMKNIFRKGIPFVCTSATLLDANGSYQYFKSGLSLDKMERSCQSVVDGRVYASPYNYEKNSLFYYDTMMTNPKNYQEYVQDLVLKVEELIRITNGRSLVLFTSKSTMEAVYRQLKLCEFDFELMMQGEMSNAQLCHKFATDVKSCLFATGSFWEGIDISGKSLCNVIITRLPFSNVDAITEYKASRFATEEAFKMVYLNDMVQKMAQGTGRLIRGNRDKGIVCCLDARCVNYIDIIKKCTPYVNFTNNLEMVYEFSGQYITNRDGKRKVKGK